MKLKPSKIIFGVVVNLWMSSCMSGQSSEPAQLPTSTITPAATFTNSPRALTETPLPAMPPPLAPDFGNVDAFPLAASTRLVMRAPDSSLQFVSLPEPVSPGFGWSSNGLNNSFSSTANGFIYEIRDNYIAVIGTSGEAAIPFFTSPFMTGVEFVSSAPRNLVVQPGATPQTARLAWSIYGWASDYSKFAQELFVVSPDGASRTTLLTESTPGRFPYIQPLRWSRDGKKLYYDRSPDGLGGWIPFGGATGLYAFDMEKGVSLELIAPDSMTAICVGDLSRDERMTVDNCNDTYELTIRRLQTGQIIKIPHPDHWIEENEIGFGKPTEAGGARFSPKNIKVAYGFNREPDASHQTQSWIAVADIASQKSQIILTAQAGELVSVIGWLNEDQLLINRYQNSGNGLWESSLWVMRADGTDLQLIAQGTLIAILEPQRF